MELHKERTLWDITTAKFQGNAALSNFFEIVTTCVDENNKTCVSTVKAKRYPIIIFQWHPEKNAFGWGSSTISHSEDANQVTQHVASYLVSEVRKSLNIPYYKKVSSRSHIHYTTTSLRTVDTQGNSQLATDEVIVN